MFQQKMNLDRIWAPARAAIFQERNFSPIGQPYPLVSVFRFFSKNLNLNRIWVPARAAIFQECNFSPTPSTVSPCERFHVFQKKKHESQPYLATTWQSLHLLHFRKPWQN